jgi:hypothetical protein
MKLPSLEAHELFGCKPIPERLATEASAAVKKPGQKTDAL